MFELVCIWGGMPSVAVYRTVSVASEFVVSVFPLEVTVTSTQYAPGVCEAETRMLGPEIDVSVTVAPVRSRLVPSDNATAVVPVNPCPLMEVMETALALLPVEGVTLVTIGPTVMVVVSEVAGVPLVEKLASMEWSVPVKLFPAATVALKVMISVVPEANAHWTVSESTALAVAALPETVAVEPETKARLAGKSTVSAVAALSPKKSMRKLNWSPGSARTVES